MLKRRLLITGCPRSGTRYVAKVLSKSGLRVSHEGLGKDGAVCSFLAVDDYYYANVHANPVEGIVVRRRDIEFEHVWHQVRNPINVIDSLVTAPLRRGIWHWYDMHCACGYEPHLEAAARFWVYWNEIAESQAEWRFRAEDIEEVWPEIRERLGLDPVDLDSIGISKNLGAIVKPRFGFDLSMLQSDTAALLTQKAREYGYDY